MAEIISGDPQGTSTDDTISTSKSERDIQAKQESSPLDSATAQEPDVDADQIDVLPGTGGPDDVGGMDIDPGELNLSGDSIPGHPKPGSPEDV
jgi:hypothetical protein